MADEFPTHRPDVTVLFGKELPAHGVLCDLVAQRAPSPPGQQEVLEWPAGELYLCPKSGSRFKDQLTALWHDLRVLWRIDKQRYRAIQVRDKVFAGSIGLLRARRLGKPFFFWMSFPMSEGFINLARQGLSLGLARWLFVTVKGHLGKYLIYRFLLPRCDHIFVQSERMAQDLARRGIPRERLTPVPMGVDLERVAEASEGASPSSQPIAGPVVAYLGVLDRARRIDFLLEVFAQVRQRVPAATLLLVGDTSEVADRQWLQAKAAELGLSTAIVWTGWLPTASAWAYLRQAQVAVSIVPRGELFDWASPTKIVEYLAFGLPVVANDQPDQHQVLSESGAGLSVPMDQGKFADAIVNILGDRQLAEQMRKAGPPYVNSRRSYGLIGRQVAQVYRTLGVQE